MNSALLPPAPAFLTKATEPDVIPRLLVIGYGNSLRNDDGVGPLAADAMETLGLPNVTSLSCPLLTPEVAEPVSRASHVVFVDASVDAPRQIKIRKLKPAASSQVMTHSASPATILALARDVFGRSPQAWLLTIPVEDLGLGDHLSDLAQNGFEFAVQWLQQFAHAWLQKLPASSRTGSVHFPAGQPR